MAKFYINDSETIVGDFLRLDGTKKMEGPLGCVQTTATKPCFGKASTDTSAAIFNSGTGETGGPGASLKFNGTAGDWLPGLITIQTCKDSVKEFRIYPKDDGTQYIKPSGSTVWNSAQLVSRPNTATNLSRCYYLNGKLLECTSSPIYRHSLRGVGTSKNYYLELYSTNGNTLSTKADIANIVYWTGCTSYDKMMPGSGGFYGSDTNTWRIRGFFAPSTTSLKVGLVASTDGEEVVDVTWSDTVFKVRA